MRLVFVAGWMRSGTTLLTELIGSAPGALAVGELSTMWTAMDGDEPCSCGRSVLSCPLWAAVATEVAEGHDIGAGRGTGYRDFSESRQRQWAGVKPQLAPPGRGVLLSAAYWVVTSVLCHLVDTRFPGYRLLRYERLTARPRETLATVSGGLGLDAPPFVTADAVQLAPSRVVNGNPSRFDGRLRTISTDERWRTQLPVTERVSVGVLTAPVRLALRLLVR